MHDGDDRSTGSPDLQLQMLLRTAPDAGVTLLIERHGAGANGMLHRRFGRYLDRSLIEDAFSKAMFEAWRYGATYDVAKGTAASWFGVICFRCALRVLAREGRFDDLRRSLADGLRSASDDPSDQWNAALDLYAAIAKLSNLPRQVVLADLAAGGRATADALGEATGSRSNSVWAARSRGHSKLRALLSGWSQDFGRRPSQPSLDANQGEASAPA